MFTRGLWNFPGFGLRTHFEELDRLRRMTRNADIGAFTESSIMPIP